MGEYKSKFANLKRKMADVTITAKKAQKNNGKRRFYARKNSEQISVAKLHIERYFELAKENYSSNAGLANRYVTLARKVAMKFKIRLTGEQKSLFCPYCYKFLKPGKENRVRVNGSHLSRYCAKCGKFWRMPLSKSNK